MERSRLKFRQLPSLYAVVRLSSDAAVPGWACFSNSGKDDFASMTRTGEELSIVCPADNVSPDVHSPHRWICLKLEGPFPFSQTGVLLSFIGPLSENGIPIFAISTFDTDYVLVQEEHATGAVKLLRQAGHALVSMHEPT